MSDTVLNYFYEISAIPRPSGKEEKIAEYLMGFAEAHGLAAVRDKANNVLIRKHASVGYEDSPAVLLQGHTDMVCEKNANVIHDFDTEGIRILRDGDILSADGTTLGADNGYAVAVMLAILADSALPHPALECLFTTSEETGLDGMRDFDKSQLTARTMLNLDSCGEEFATAACAGGVRTHFCRMPKSVPCPVGALRMTVSGLMGGHSGENIHCGRANALKTCARLYLAASAATELHMISMEGGNKDNAIPRECTVLFSAEDIEAAEDALRKEETRIRKSLNADDSGFTVTITEETSGGVLLSKEDEDALLALMRVHPCGPLRMSHDIEGLVETSSNTASVHADGAGIKLISSSRSLVESELDDLCALLDTAAKVSGFAVSHHSRYPGWAFTVNSRLQKVYLDAYRALFGKEASIIGIHAGLECGLMKEAIPEMDTLSIGPNIYDLHTPDERMSVSSAARIYTLVLRILADLK